MTTSTPKPAALADNPQMLTDAGIQRMLELVQPSRKSNTQMWLRLPPTVTQRAIDASGLDEGDLLRISAYPSAYFDAFGELLEIINNRCIYPVVAQTADAHYFAALHENNQLHVSYQLISGGRHVATLTDAQVNKLVEILALQLSPTRERLSELKADMDLEARSLLEDLALLSSSEGKIHLPVTHLNNYPKIKHLLQIAGGKYNSKGFFTFPAGMGCELVLEKLKDGQKVNLKKDFQFFATPASRGREVCNAAGPLAGRRVLEPSAGDGALTDIAVELGAEVVSIETWEVNILKLQAKGYAPLKRDFLQVTPEEIGLFDAVIANPPFSNNQDIDHVVHMLSFLKPGGTLSTIMSTAWQEGTQKKQSAFREFLATQNVRITPIPSGVFIESGTNVPSVHLVLHKEKLVQDEALAA